MSRHSIARSSLLRVVIASSGFLLATTCSVMPRANNPSTVFQGYGTVTGATTGGSSTGATAGSGQTGGSAVGGTGGSSGGSVVAGSSAGGGSSGGSTVGGGMSGGGYIFPY